MAARTRSISASHPTTQMRLLLPRAVSLRWVSDINVYFLNARSVIPWRPIVKFFTDTLHSAPKKWGCAQPCGVKIGIGVDQPPRRVSVLNPDVTFHSLAGGGTGVRCKRLGGPDDVLDNKTPRVLALSFHSVHSFEKIAQLLLGLCRHFSSSVENLDGPLQPPGAPGGIIVRLSAPQVMKYRSPEDRVLVQKPNKLFHGLREVLFVRMPPQHQLHCQSRLTGQSLMWAKATGSHLCPSGWSGWQQLREYKATH